MITIIIIKVVNNLTMQVTSTIKLIHFRLFKAMM